MIRKKIEYKHAYTCTYIHLWKQGRERLFGYIKANRNMYIGGEWGTLCIVTNNIWNNGHTYITNWHCLILDNHNWSTLFSIRGSKVNNRYNTYNAWLRLTTFLISYFPNNFLPSSSLFSPRFDSNAIHGIIGFSSLSFPTREKKINKKRKSSSKSRQSGGVTQEERSGNSSWSNEPRGCVNFLVTMSRDSSGSEVKFHCCANKPIRDRSIPRDVWSKN